MTAYMMLGTYIHVMGITSCYTILYTWWQFAWGLPTSKIPELLKNNPLKHQSHSLVGLKTEVHPYVLDID